MKYTVVLSLPDDIQENVEVIHVVAYSPADAVVAAKKSANGVRAEDGMEPRSDFIHLVTMEGHALVCARS
jgi:hypothetical protein